MNNELWEYNPNSVIRKNLLRLYPFGYIILKLRRKIKVFSEKLFDFLGVEIVDGVPKTDETDQVKTDILRVYVTDGAIDAKVQEVQKIER